ncbi:MAG: MFS transporter [Chloroflexi bacterium]|nr:MFS transporter [Chloroflexota bacterium]
MENYNLRKIQIRIAVTLFASQSLTSAGLIAIATVLTIVAADLGGSEALAGIPNAINNLASAPAAYLLGLLWDRAGRRRGLTLGLAFGVLGAWVALAAVQAHNFGLLLAAMVGLGAARAASQLSRFIAAEVSPPEQRGRAISYVVLGGTVGAVAGPLLVDPSSGWALAAGLPELAGPFAAGVALYLLGMAVVWLGLRPEPLTVAMQLAAALPKAEQPQGAARPLPELLRQPAVVTAILAMSLSQMVMIGVMGITSLYMRHNDHELSAISLVFSAHTLGMFAFSVLSGRLSDRWGRFPVILMGCLILLASFGLAPVSTGTPLLSVALFLLGLGWNFCFVGGSALLADQLTPAERARAQGFNDVFLGLAAAAASYLSGLAFAAWGFAFLNLLGALFTLIPLTAVLLWRRGQRTPQFAVGD